MLDDVKTELNELKKIIDTLTKTIMTPRLEPTHVKTKEACNFLKCSRNNLIKICANNDIRPVKIKGCGENYFRVTDLKRAFPEQ